MTLDASGNLGIGTTSPAQKFHISNAGGAIGLIQNTASSVDTRFRCQNLTSSFEMGHDSTGGYLQEFGAYPIAFYTNNAERMRLDSDGNFMVGTTSAGGSDSMSMNFAKANGTIYVNHVTGTATTTNYAIFSYAGGLIGNISQSGTTAVLYNTTSDHRLKENIADADSASSLIDSLKVRQFDWKSDNSHQRYGFVAQELVNVAPEAVHQPTDANEMMAVDYSKLVPMLVKEVQSLRKRLADAGI
jgi:hypothetical protein